VLVKVSAIAVVMMSASIFSVEGAVAAPGGDVVASSTTHEVTLSDKPFLRFVSDTYTQLQLLNIHAATTLVPFTLPPAYAALNLTSVQFTEGYETIHGSNESENIQTEGDCRFDPVSGILMVPVTVDPLDDQGSLDINFTGTGQADPDATIPVGFQQPGSTLLLDVRLRTTTLPELGGSDTVDLAHQVVDTSDTENAYANADSEPVVVSPGDDILIHSGRTDFFHTISHSIVESTLGQVASTTATTSGNSHDDLRVSLPTSLSGYVDPAGHGTALAAYDLSRTQVNDETGLHSDANIVVVPFVLAYHDDGTPYFADAQDPTATFYPYIQWMGTSGISRGTAQADAPPLFLPLATVSRQAMAEFLYRLSGETFDPGSSSAFADVPASSTFNTAIQWMASKGISTGTAQDSGKPLFKPNDVVTRQAMAEFLARYSGADLSQPPQQTGFADVAGDSDFAAAIAWMNTAGISTGTAQPSGLPLYKPMDAVTRQAMAAFLYRLDAK
jgi:hypothetical protein